MPGRKWHAPSYTFGIALTFAARPSREVFKAVLRFGSPCGAVRHRVAAASLPSGAESPRVRGQHSRPGAALGGCCCSSVSLKLPCVSSNLACSGTDRRDMPPDDGADSAQELFRLIDGLARAVDLRPLGVDFLDESSTSRFFTQAMALYTPFRGA